MQLRKRFLFHTIVLICLLGCSPIRQGGSFPSDHSADTITTFTNPIIANGADPWVFKENSARGAKLTFITVIRSLILMGP